MKEQFTTVPIALFAFVAGLFAIVSLLDWSTPLSLTVLEGDDGVIQNAHERTIEPGAIVRERGVIHTAQNGAVLTYTDGLQLVLDERTRMEVRSLSTPHFLFTRGHWTAEPEEPVTLCTRAVCVETEEPVDMFYYTPGEVVEIRPGGPLVVTFEEERLTVNRGDRVVIDELTGAISLTY